MSLPAIPIDPEDGETVTTEVTGGAVKCQWKADWAMRWFALGVDYEMSGKDLIDSVKLSTQICRALGTEPPDASPMSTSWTRTARRSRSPRGNGLTIEQWLTYASPEGHQPLLTFRPGTAAARRGLIPIAGGDERRDIFMGPERAMRMSPAKSRS